MSKQEVILCKELESSLTQAIEKCSPDRLFVLTDEHTHRLCLPQIKDIPVMRQNTHSGQLPCGICGCPQSVLFGCRHERPCEQRHVYTVVHGCHRRKRDVEEASQGTESQF